MMDAPLIKSYNGAHYYLVTVPFVYDKCKMCSKTDDTDCTDHTQVLPFEQQCGPAPVIYIRATANDVAKYILRRMER